MIQMAKVLTNIGTSAIWTRYPLGIFGKFLKCRKSPKYTAHIHISLWFSIANAKAQAGVKLSCVIWCLILFFGASAPFNHSQCWYNWSMSFRLAAILYRANKEADYSISLSRSIREDHRVFIFLKMLWSTDRLCIFVINNTNLYSL